MHAEELAFSLLTGCSGSPVADKSLPPTHRVSPMPGSDSMVTVAASRHYHCQGKSSADNHAPTAAQSVNALPCPRERYKCHTAHDSAPL